MLNKLIALLSLWTLYLFPNSIDISQLMDKYKVPGVAVAYISKDDIRYEVFGMANRNQEVNQETVFQIASISKTIFAVAVMNWLEGHNISIRSQIGSIANLDEFDERFNLLTFEEILTHRAGLNSVSYPGYLSSEPLPTLRQSIRGIRKSHPRLFFNPNQKGNFEYSGGGYTLLQLALEMANNKPIEELIQDELYDRIGGMMPISKVKAQHSADPHNTKGQPQALRHNIETAAAGISHSITDLAQFTRYLLMSENIPMIDRMTRDYENDYGLGLESETNSSSNRVVFHTGANKGWRSGLFCLPETQEGFAILTNGDSGYPLVCEIANAWLIDKGFGSFSLHNENKNEEQIILALSIIFGLLGVFGLGRFLTQVVLKKREVIFSIKRLLFACALSSVAIGWYLLFFTTLLPLTQWEIIAFMPYGFATFSWVMILNLLIGTLFMISKTCKQ